MNNDATSVNIVSGSWMRNISFFFLLPISKNGCQKRATPIQYSELENRVCLKKKKQKNTRTQLKLELFTFINVKIVFNYCYQTTTINVNVTSVPYF